jgi:hypothetical protein
MAREFALAMGQMGYGRKVVAFDWSPSTIVREPGEAERNIGPSLMIGAYRRDEVPPEAVEMVDGFALTLAIPDKAWRPDARRLIDVDEEQWSRLALR